LRTLDEIAVWGSMSAEQQWAVVRTLEDRRREVAEDVVNRIKTHISTSPAVLFMKGTPDFPQCGFSAQAVAALRANGVNSFHSVNIFEDPELRDVAVRGSVVAPVADQEARARGRDRRWRRVLGRLIDAGVVQIGNVEITRRQHCERCDDGENAGDTHVGSPHIPAVIDSQKLRLGGYGATS
jgi:hypothetical protein